MLRIIATAALVGLMSCAHAQSAPRPLPRVFLSQGEWNGAKLTDSGRLLIGDAVKDAVDGTITQININGMADLASSPVSQRRMSDARVKTTQHELIRIGVAEQEIGVQGVETADGSVPPPSGEAATKRVVIVVHY